jgi:hypothetical protein
LNELDFIANDLKCFISGLMAVWFVKGEEKMSMEMTPEEVTELGKQLGEIWLANLTVDELLDRFGREEVLSHFKPEVIEEYLKKVKRQ